jgi:hypothetical protein
MALQINEASPRGGENFVRLNKKEVPVRQMYLGDSEAIHNGIELCPEYTFGFPNKYLNPYLLFYSDGKYN